MKNIGTFAIGLTVFALGAVGCEAPQTSDTESADTTRQALGENGAAADGAAAASPENNRVALERAMRELDRGGDPDAVKDQIEDILADAALTPDDRANALMGLSRALEAQGDIDGAADAVEEILRTSERSDNGIVDSAERRLRWLLTGNEKETALELSRSEPVSPVAYRLSKYFTPDDNNHTLIDVCVLGYNRQPEAGIGDIAEAKRLSAEQSLVKDTHIGRSITSSGSWISLPRMLGEQAKDMPNPDRSMVVFFYDLEDNRVPSRYDAYLPIPSDEIAGVLAQGNGLIAVRERPHAKPTIVIAAPREAQLGIVHDVFANLNEIPREPMVVELEKKLSSSEIQATIRGSFGDFRACYDTARKRDGSLSGTMHLTFSVDGTGRVVSTKLGDGSTLTDSALAACALGVVSKLSFPASNSVTATAVTYPITMTP